MHGRHELLALAAAGTGLLLLAACAAQQAPPPAAPRPPATATPIAAPITPPPPALTPTPAPTPAAEPAPSPAGPIHVTIGTPATNETLFLPEAASVPTRADVVLTFENASTLPHNLTFGPPIDAGTATILKTGAADAFSFTAPEPGQYEFVCTLHPWMTGTLVVTEAP